MPINLPSYMQPRNATHPDPSLRGTYYLMEDIYLRGGYQVRNDHSERDQINPLNLKPGMWVKTLNDGKIWEYTAQSTWTLVEFGSGGGSGALPQRTSMQVTTPQILGASSYDFNLNIGPTCLVLKLQVDKQCIVEAHSTVLRNDTNPYTFVATETKLIDDGLTDTYDDNVIKNRRYSILSNLEVPVQRFIYFRITNSDPQPKTVTLQLVTLPTESLPTS